MKHSFVKVVGGCVDYPYFEQRLNQTITTSEELGCTLRNVKFVVEPHDAEGEYNCLHAVLIFDSEE